MNQSNARVMVTKGWKCPLAEELPNEFLIFRTRRLRTVGYGAA